MKKKNRVVVFTLVVKELHFFYSTFNSLISQYTRNGYWTMEFTKQIATPTFIWGTECHSWKITDFYLDLGRVSFDLCLYNFCVSLGKSFNLSEYQSDSLSIKWVLYRVVRIKWDLLSTRHTVTCSILKIIFLDVKNLHIIFYHSLL